MPGRHATAPTVRPFRGSISKALRVIGPSSPSNGQTIAAAAPEVAMAHFSRLLALETDCADVAACLRDGDVDFVLLHVVGSPEAFGTRLGIRWHAFATQDRSTSSTLLLDFCKVPPDFDLVHGVQTKYLIKFNVNTGSKLSLVPFQIYAQPEVREITMTLFSNIDALSGKYRFVLR